MLTVVLTAAALAGGSWAQGNRGGAVLVVAVAVALLLVLRVRAR